jgi:hypothetical protein
MSISLLDTFSSLDQHIKDQLADLDSPSKLSYAVLQIACEKCSVDRLSSEHIVACLEQAGVAIKKVSISRALTSTNGCVSVTRDIDGEVLYKLMTKGKRQIDEILGTQKLTVIHIEGNHPRTARKRLAEIFNSFSSSVNICDPYYGARTLDSLDHIPLSTAVKFLTAKTSEAIPSLHRAFRDFQREHSKVEFRIAEKPNELHDRYAVTRSELLILGHGIKDIGGRESFIVRLNKEHATGLIREVLLSFDSRWLKGTPI